MRNEPDVMPHDANVLQQVLDDHDITVKRVSFLTDRDGATIYRYLGGTRTIPSHVLRSVFEDCLDLRLLRLVSGRAPVEFFITPGELPPIEGLFASVCETLECVARSARHMGKITCDGRIDANDADAIKDFNRNANDAVAKLTVAIAALAKHSRSEVSEKG